MLASKVKGLVRHGSFNVDKSYNRQRSKEKEAEKEYPLEKDAYENMTEIGRGGGAVVYKALCKPFNETLAVKVFDLERLDQTLEEISSEVVATRMYEHPAIVRAYCSFVVGAQLWIIMPFMAAGSALRIMEVSFKNGFEEDMIATVLWEVLKALDYIHSCGGIHRDVKACNILVDLQGNVKLADFGISASMFQGGTRNSRRTFTGTPQWMAPEVIEEKPYDFKADIWSFGITALELAHGRAPFAGCPPMKVLMQLITRPPPELNEVGDNVRFGKSFKQMIDRCLQKNPCERPTAEKLLKDPFFAKHARSADYLLQTVISKLPPLGEGRPYAAA